MTKLEKALSEIATNKIQPENLENAFDEISVILLRNTKLVADQAQYLTNEIEFYFSSDYYNHHDPYAHSNQYKTVQRQGEFGEWYFHRYKSAENYEKQKFRGLDITFGNEGSKNYGGILIRQIQEIDCDEPIGGISNIVGEIMNKIKASGLDDMATITGRNVFNINSILHLENCTQTNEKPIYKSIRVIPKHNQEENVRFYLKLYRYFNYPEIKQVRP